MTLYGVYAKLYFHEKIKAFETTQHCVIVVCIEYFIYFRKRCIYLKIILCALNLIIFYISFNYI
jgi:hypothetical protein